MIYKEIDQRIGRFQVATGLFCPPGCGACCESPNVEVTVLEVLPLAEEILLRREEERALNAIEEKEDQGDLRCIHHRPDGPDSEKGKCSCYPLRPLVCRLFGFASRRTKFGEIELSTCKILKEKKPEAFRRARIGLREGLEGCRRFLTSSQAFDLSCSDQPLFTKNTRLLVFEPQPPTTELREFTRINRLIFRALIDIMIRNPAG
ncbi:MAG: YkgJ family cysteine cluster protein [Pseudomonadota bacterium]